MKRMLLFIAFVVAAIVLLKGLNAQQSTKPFVPPASAVATLPIPSDVLPTLPGQYTATYIKALTKEESKLVQSALSGLDMVAKRSPSAKAKLIWIRRYGIPATFSTNGDSIIPSRLPNEAYAIWLIPFGEQRHVGQGDATMAMGYVARLRAVLFSAGNFSPVMKGILLAHELQHADDNINHGVRMDPNDREARDLEERSAYMFEHQVLEEYSQGRWSHAVQASLADRQVWKVRQGLAWQGLTFQDMPKDSIYLVRACPGINRYDLGPLSVQLAIDTNFHLVDSVAAGNDAIRQEGQRTFLRRYFSWLQDGKMVE